MDMKIRTVKTLLPADLINMGGMPVRQAFPSFAVEHIDPFLLLHHADIKVPEHVVPRHAGVGPHPHRGFSPVTFIFKGGVHHRDSRGNNSVVRAGGAQWMNAGMGVIHSERPTDDIHQSGGYQEFIQLWINTPARHKMDQPEYFPLQKGDIPMFVTEDDLVSIAVVSGEILGVRGPLSGKTPVNAATLVARSGGRISIPLPAHHNSFIYLLDGKINLEGFGLTEGLHAAVFEADGEFIAFTAMEDTRMLLVSGEPLNEKVVARGPFVMNSETQILEAMRDYQKGKMGILIED
jgi:redox-sensitive bicupin YhaK (pirin superfamily)